uniref:Uncharacterized protein n=1 Tax=Anguilla anguilla TaxID=7936 RepID=A0A0E9WAJ5_ANGAN
MPVLLPFSVLSASFPSQSPHVALLMPEATPFSLSVGCMAIGNQKIRFNVMF